MATQTRPQDESNPSFPERPPAKDKKRPARPPDSIPDLLPGLDPEQTPGIDRTPAENDPDAAASGIMHD